MRDLVGYLAAAFLLFLLIFCPPKAWSCDCTWYAYSSIKRYRIPLATVPAVVVTDQQRYPGSYSRGVVYVKDIDDCRVILHEFIHHAQWLKYGDAQDMHEWQRRENQAAMATMLIESGATCE